MSEKTNENQDNEKVVNKDINEAGNIDKKENTKTETGNMDKQENVKAEEKEPKKTTKKSEEPKKSIAREIMEWIICIVIALVLALIIKYFLFTPTLVLQESMTPTILNGERVLINRLVRTFNLELKRGDIITFEAPAYHELKGEGITATYHEVEGLIDSFFYNVVESNKVSYIKRVIGIAGDEIEIKEGNVYVNGELQEEPYLEPTEETHIPEGGMPSKFTVPEGYIFAMGDNREGSSDCRLFGCIPLEKVEGRVSIRIWPLTKFGGIDK